MTVHLLTDDTVRELAEAERVCIRPLLNTVHDTVTGQARTVTIACGSTRASVCPSCADKARKLRIHQCREGWHREEEPPAVMVEVPDLADTTETQAVAAARDLGLIARTTTTEHPTIAAGQIVEQSRPAGDEVETGRVLGLVVSTGPATDEPRGVDSSTRRVRSTRRRQDVPNLPKAERTASTLGRTITTASGETLRPSFFLTLTMGSYGLVHSAVKPHEPKSKTCACGRRHHADDPLLSMPVDPDSYDYRRAALDAMHFPKVIDRFWQNLRRATGQAVQYFATVEPQKRLTPHLHAALRGTFDRSLMRDVVAATYHQVWWPPHEHPVYVDTVPVWDDAIAGYVDPTTGHVLPTWGEALDALDADDDAEPAHVVQLGSQVDMKGVMAGTAKADKTIGYLTKYLVKDISEAIADDDTVMHPARLDHIDRLADEVRWLPCTPECANWLRFGIQPKGATEAMRPGECGAKVHDRAHLGIGGRRVLVSRKWTGKTLTEHKADRASVVRQVLADAGYTIDDHDQYSGTVTGPDGKPRYEWKANRPGDPNGPSYVRAIAHTIHTAQRWRAEYQAAQAIIRDRPPDDRSATDTAAA